jgi:hypothetical protein
MFKLLEKLRTQGTPETAVAMVLEKAFAQVLFQSAQLELSKSAPQTVLNNRREALAASRLRKAKNLDCGRSSRDGERFVAFTAEKLRCVRETGINFSQRD